MHIDARVFSERNTKYTRKLHRGKGKEAHLGGDQLEADKLAALLRLDQLEDLGILSGEVGVEHGVLDTHQA